MNNNFNNADFLDDDTIDDDFDMLDDSPSLNNNFSNNSVFSQNGIDMQNISSSDISYNQMQNSSSNETYVNSSLEQGVSYQQTPSDTYNNFVQPVNNDSSSVLASMYDDKSSSSFEEELKTARPFATPEVEKVVEEAPKEVTYTDDFMDYDPMLHNDLVTDGNYTITQYDPSQESDYVPEQTNFDSEGMMEFYSNENVEVEKPKEEEQPVIETFNTNGMMQFSNPTPNPTLPDMPSQEGVASDVTMEKTSRFINNNIDVDNVLPTDGDIPENKGSISVYNKKEEKEKSETRKAAELVFTVIVIALLILLVSFFPDINNFFTNLGK